jgi:prolyl 4-hydroxylase
MDYGTLSPAPGVSTTTETKSAVSVALPVQVNPFETNLVQRRPWWLYLCLVPMWCVLIPLRFVGYVTVMLSLWLWCKILTLGASEPFGHRRRTCIAYVACGHLQCLLLLAGIWVRWDGKRERLRQLAHGVIVSNHIGYLDALVLTAYTGCSPVAKAEIRAYWFFGVLGETLQAIWVQRADKQNRHHVLEAILRRARCGTAQRSCLLFPEGTNGNGQALLQFRKGVFTGGMPVHPVAFRCRFSFFDPAHLEENLVKHGLTLFFLNIYHVVDVCLLEEYVPSEVEKACPILYARNVQRRIASEIDVPATELTYLDNPRLRAKLHLDASSASKTKTTTATSRITHELLRLPGSSGGGRSKFACLLRNVFTEVECAELIARSEEAGYTAVANDAAPGERNNCRATLTDPAFAAELFRRIRTWLPETHVYVDPYRVPRVTEVDRLLEVNECLRFQRYDPNQLFPRHVDGATERQDGSSRTHVTAQVYLNGNFEGGATTFLDPAQFHSSSSSSATADAPLDVVPETGMVLLFDHEHLHTGAELTRGRKYTLRTDIFYRVGTTA